MNIMYARELLEVIHTVLCDENPLGFTDEEDPRVFSYQMTTVQIMSMVAAYAVSFADLSADEKDEAVRDVAEMLRGAMQACPIMPVELDDELSEHLTRTILVVGAALLVEMQGKTGVAKNTSAAN